MARRIVVKTKRKKTKKKDVIDGLTTTQAEAMLAILERLADGERFTALRGYAGTGKTHLVGRLVAQLQAQRERVYVCAPTHKATQVLREKLDDAWVGTQTLHAFLGLRLVPDRRGGYRLTPDPDRDLPHEGIVVVDEASMIGSEEWSYIEAAPYLQWVFVGDPAQLPPVTETASPALDIDGPTLDEIVRQARENPILALATAVREQTTPVQWAPAMHDGVGVGVTHNPDAFLQSALRAFATDTFRRDGNHARVLAYRNRTVAAYNQRIRQALYKPGAPRFVKGEWLAARETWYYEDVPVLINSEEVRVRRAVEDEDDSSDTGPWKIWRLTVGEAGSFGTQGRTLTVLHEDEAARYQAELRRLRDDARENDRRWDAFYALKERFAQVDYAYAMTIHKAQGSTYHTAFVDQRDARTCRGPERQALLYVAVTRPAQRLALLV